MSIFPSTSRPAKKRRKEEISPLTAQVIGILCTTMGVLLFLGVVSFHPHDPVLFMQQELFSDSLDSAVMHNWVGKVGSTLGFALLGLIGAAAYLAPILLAVFGIRAWVGEDLEIKFHHVLGAVLAIVSLSAFSQLRLPAIPMLSDVAVGLGMAGGISGYWLAWVLEQNFAYLGSHILLAATFVVSLVLLSPTLIPGTARRLFQWSGAAKGVVQSQMARRAEERELNISIKPNKSVKINRSLPIRGGIGGLLSFRDAEKTNVESPEKSEEVSTPNEADDSHGSPSKAPSVPVYGSVSKTYRPPSPAELLTSVPGRSSRQTDQVLESQSQVLTQTLEDFGIEGKVTEVHPGPVITMYEFAPGPGIKVSRIVNLADDLAMALKALKVRVVAPLPGKSTVGIEVPNPIRETVSLKDMLTSPAFVRSHAKLALALGKDIYGHPVISDLRTMPHLLVAGATGAGKSVGLNCMLLNILFTAHPDEVKLLLIDPKVLELQVYDGVPHLIRPVITDPKSAARGLTWVVQEMERRYRMLAEHGVRSIDAYNRKVAEQQQLSRSLKPLKKKARSSGTLENAEATTDDPADVPLTHLPYIVVVIDEFADLMMVAPKEVEDRIARLAQMARASGIHLILATQRPSVDVVTGLIKANFPVRIAYQVSSKIDSRTILDANGAETLLGKGDMLYMASGSGRITRLHGPFVSDDEVRDVVEWVKQQATPVYEDDEFFSNQETSQEDEVRDETYERARELIMETGQASASFIQRRLRVGYPRAARMIEQMEGEGLVSAPGRDGRREVLVRQAVIGEAG